MPSHVQNLAKVWRTVHDSTIIALLSRMVQLELHVWGCQHLLSWGSKIDRSPRVWTRSLHQPSDEGARIVFFWNFTNVELPLFQAIRSEYLKLKGVMFGWVEGTYPSSNTRIVVKFQTHFNLMNYTHWNNINTLYFSQVSSHLYIHLIIILYPSGNLLLHLTQSHRSEVSIMIAMKLSLTYLKEDTLNQKYKKYTRLSWNIN